MRRTRRIRQTRRIQRTEWIRRTQRIQWIWRIRRIQWIRQIIIIIIIIILLLFIYLKLTKLQKLYTHRKFTLNLAIPESDMLINVNYLIKSEVNKK